MSVGVSKSKGPTGIVPIEPEHDRWAFMVDGFVIWSGGEEACRRRMEIAQAKLLRGVAPPQRGLIERAIRTLG